MEQKRYTYYAFISYKRKDTQWAKWLQRKLQTYRLPARTRKQYKDLPMRLSPVFLDRTNLRPGPLHDGLREEVQSAKYLVVICSRAAGQESRYLDFEIQAFLDGGGTPERIIPFIVDDAKAPEQECFPERLRALNQESTILGANVHDSGRRGAFLKVIAYMQGLKLEEVENEDARRRRRNRRIAVSAGLALILSTAFGAYRYWDYNVPKTAYFLDYTDRWGVPEGIGPLKKEEIDEMSSHYTLISCQGKVRQLRHEDAFGQLVPTQNIYLVDRPTRADYEYAEDDVLDKVTYYSAENEPLLVLDYVQKNLKTINLQAVEKEDAYDNTAYMQAHTTAGFGNLFDDNQQLNRSRIVRYLVDYDANGFVRELRYCGDKSENLTACDADGVAGLRYERDGLNRVVRQFYLTYTGTSGLASRAEDYSVIGNRNGIYGLALEYSDAGDLTGTTWLDGENRPVNGTSGFASEICEYDDHHREVRADYFDEGGAPVLRAEGFATLVTAYDSHGFIVEQTYLGLDGKPCMSTIGFASVRIQRDERGRMVRTDVFDAEGSPGSLSGVTRIVYAYDEAGHVTEESHFDAGGRPTLDTYGVFCTRAEYDGDGHMISIRHEGTDGTLTLATDGTAGADSTYADDLEIRQVFVGTDGRPALCNDGFAQIDFEYDVRGNITQVRYSDVRGLPTLCAQGYAAIAYTYDAQGNRTSSLAFDTDGQPVLNKNGYARLTVDYDRCGQEILRSYFDTEGRPALLAEGCAAIAREYDARGNIIREDRLDGEGRNTLCTDGCATVTSEYDSYGRRLAIAYLDAEGNPVPGPDGCARVEYAYDERGLLVSTRYYDAQGRPTMCRNGLYFAEETEYDALRRPVKTTYLGTNGAPKRCDNNYAISERTYDARGNCVRESLFDTNGQPVKCYEGYATAEWRYDDRSRLQQQCFYGVNGQAILCAQGYSRVDYAYDDRNRLVRTAYFGVDGLPIGDHDGVAAYESTYDARGNLTSQKALGPKGDSIRWSASEFDARDNEIRNTNLDAEGKPAPDIDGVAIYEMDYDALCRKTEIRQLDAGGELTLSSSQGYAVQTIEYDARGNEADFRFYDANRQPMLIANGYFRRARIYDARGNIIEEDFYDTQGRPIVTAFGYASCLIDYDARGNITQWAWFDADGAPAISASYGCAMVRYEYDEFGKEVGRSWYGTEGQLVAGPQGYASCHYTYNDAGIRVKVSYYDEHGQLISEENLLRACIVATGRDDAVIDRKGLEQFSVITRLGDWRYENYAYDDEMMFSDFQAAISAARKAPAECWYLQYDEGEGQFKLYSEVFETGQMNLRLMDLSIEEDEFQVLIAAATGTPTPRPISARE